MNVFAHADGFAVSVFGSGDYETEWNADKTLTLRATGEQAFVSVTTNRGTFIETLNEQGEVVQQGGDSNWYYVTVGKEPMRLRHRELPDPNLTVRELNKARQTVTRYLVSDSPYSLNLPETLAGVIKWMEERLATIPEASRKKARFNFGTTMEYGETYPQIEITYPEKETDEEVVRRVQIERERERLKDLAERAQLARLSAKFDGRAR